MSIFKLSNLLLLQIITDIEDNVDIICLLLTCKHLYHNSSLKRLIRFKGIKVIDTRNRDVSKQFIATVNHFNLNSFKDILVNSVADQHTLLPDSNDYPNWIQDYITEENRVNKSNIALVNYYDSKSIIPIYEIPSIETLYINQHHHSNKVDLSSISLLPHLQRLSVRSHGMQLGHHSSLKSLVLGINDTYARRFDITDLELNQLVSLTELTFKSFIETNLEYDIFPSSLTSLTLRMIRIPARDAFLPLTSLVHFKLIMDGSEFSQDEVEHQQFIDLSSLNNLKSFKFKENESAAEYNIEISLPLSINTLILLSTYIQISSQSKMPFLEKLYVYHSLLIDERIRLSSSPSLKKLVIYDCYSMISSTIIIPKSVEKLTIHNETDHYILGQVVFPPSLTHLSIIGNFYEPVKPLPESLIKLKQTVTESSLLLSLPQHLRRLHLQINVSSFKHLAFPSSSNHNNNNNSDNYPPHLETLNFNIKGYSTIDIPPITKYLSLSLEPNPKPGPNDPQLPIYSISSRIPITITDQSQQWLPVNTTHLTCGIPRDLRRNSEKDWVVAFRLDEVINHTTVRYLSLNFSNRYSKVNTTLQFSIQRLDSDNKNVLVLERQTLAGGIITQRRKSINTLQQKEFYPIYLYYNSKSLSPFEFRWSFTSFK
ncbi:hypothetical protein DFA_02388 [Cavenderia fasciculata]|uniref:Uncharacterized protein n=1 Tax=Cavenderia fasciculata TaxID=261658 RepID=F4PZB2_CACFS|nr:uncharacterized protein DFA_02388 [Cavenderia fasciculata]EGG19141.1 hypothetical protein DFA_02388 [Cavenderia fasciculata]|eukprot:XP_004366774.1 hypothetical protein DFA_02388 [Cavenderia fasciculata]